MYVVFLDYHPTMYSFYNQLATIQGASGAMQGMQGGYGGQQSNSYGKPPLPAPGQPGGYGQPQNTQPYGQSQHIPYQASPQPGQYGEHSFCCLTRLTPRPPAYCV